MIFYKGEIERNGENMKKVLLAMESEVLADGVYEMLSDAYQVFVCHDGCDALELMQMLRPDVAVVDMMLPGLDAVAMLHTVRDLGISSRVVAFSNLFPEYTVAALEQLRVDCLVRSSVKCHHVLAARVQDLAEQHAPITDTYRTMLETLAILGFKRKGESHRALETALELYRDNPKMPFVAGLYPAVAARCGSTSTGVEKAIRDYISGAWEKGNQRIWALYFPPGKNGKMQKPSNREFIIRISECIRNQTAPAENTDSRGDRIAL